MIEVNDQLKTLGAKAWQTDKLANTGFGEA